MPIRFDATTSYTLLRARASGFKPNLRAWFEKDPERAGHFHVRSENILFDYSRQLIDRNIFTVLAELAVETNLTGKVQSMFRGEKINITEDRAVLHTALRNLSGSPVCVDGRDVMPEIMHVLDKTRNFSSEILNGIRRGITGKKIKNIVSIGIGGSYLGPEYLAEACKPYAAPGMNLKFISNVDGGDFVQKTQGLDPEETLFVIVSKTFTTAETMKNARSAKNWMFGKLGPSSEVVKKHFIAVSTAKDKVSEFGIDPENIFEFWDWVGGRYSATSAVGAVPLSLYLGFENFHKILKGAYWMDRHFLDEPFESNIPMLAGLLDIWNINFMGLSTRAILPYSQAYSRYAQHCQQTEMESNGKRVDIEGNPVTFSTGEVIFGEPGTNGQHSFYQLLHQGTSIIPCDFIGFINPQFPLTDDAELTHHEELMTNYFAQPDALAFGSSNSNGHKDFPGNRPSNLFLLKKQDPFSAGILLALLEHRAAVKGFVWGINSFDQFGVELGKKLGVDMRQRIELWKASPYNIPKVFEGLNPSTAAIFRAFLDGEF